MKKNQKVIRRSKIAITWSIDFTGYLKSNSLHDVTIVPSPLYYTCTLETSCLSFILQVSLSFSIFGADKKNHR